MGNELQAGQSRFGEIFDGDESTPRTHSQLQRDTDGRIALFVPWSSDQREEQFRRWFASPTTMFGDDPDRTRYDYTVPQELLFQDHQGPVVLVGCSSAGYSESWGWGMGAGRARVQYAVLGGRCLRYATINGLRTEISGLHSWLGTSRIQVGERELGLPEFRVTSAPPIPVAGIEGMTLNPTFRRSRGSEGETVLRESMLVQTLWEESQPWREHWALHRAMRDLVAIATWRDEQFTELHVSRDDDPVRVATGEAAGRAWHPVIAAELSEAKTSPWRSGRDFLFRHADLLPGALETWIDLRNHHGRAVDPIVAALRMRSATVEVALAQVGIGMEALGYQLAAMKYSKATANKKTFAERLEIVANDLAIAPPFDVGDWVARTTTAYNGIKHANRIMPAPVEQLNRVRESQLIFRMWVATRLGMDPTLLGEAAKNDQLAKPYVVNSASV